METELDQFLHKLISVGVPFLQQQQQYRDYQVLWGASYWFRCCPVFFRVAASGSQDYHLPICIKPLSVIYTYVFKKSRFS